MSRAATVHETFPSIDRIGDDDLRAGVLDAWTTTLEETGDPDLEALPWYPPIQTEVGLPDETLADHVRDVTAAAIALTETLVERRGAVASPDTVLAASLVHDVSKPYEFEGFDATAVFDALGHPVYGVHVCARAGLPLDVIHIVQCHSGNTALEPASLEAEIVIAADHLAAATAVSGVLDDLREW